MSKPNAQSAHVVPMGGDFIRFRLYIAAGTPNAGYAIANLQAICQEYLRDRHEIEIVDLLEYPLRVLSEGVLVTPTLVKLSPPPMRTIVGNLSDPSIVLHGLGLKEGVK
jgi:circadian clock protein KaiB